MAILSHLKIITMITRNICLTFFVEKLWDPELACWVRRGYSCCQQWENIHSCSVAWWEFSQFILLKLYRDNVQSQSIEIIEICFVPKTDSRHHSWSDVMGLVSHTLRFYTLFLNVTTELLWSDLKLLAK